MTIPKSIGIAAVALLFGMATYGVLRFYSYRRLQPLIPRANIPRVVLQATNVIHYAAGSADDEQLLVGLTSDGKVEWDTSAGNLKYERETTAITPEQIASVQYALDATDKGGLRDEMGPYNNYIDTWVELRVRIESPNGERQFSVLDPWPGVRLIKPLPKEVKTIICEASKLRAKVAKETLENMCESSL
ncbi:MAG: hypothetical protein LAO19_14025 [Acidobacteriia bacterium]|nr:hypothetical protein [Terriglobia bacterium]